QNGVAVIEQLKRADYDLIFMDVQMPEMNGLETTEFIINKMNLSKKPVIIAMTAFALEGDKEKCIAAGMDDYISKPFLIEEIVDIIRKWSSGGSKIKTTVESNPVKTESPSMINSRTIGRLKEMTGDNDSTFFKQ